MDIMTWVRSLLPYKSFTWQHISLIPVLGSRDRWILIAHFPTSLAVASVPWQSPRIRQKPGDLVKPRDVRLLVLCESFHLYSSSVFQGERADFYILTARWKNPRCKKKIYGYRRVGEKTRQKCKCLKESEFSGVLSFEYLYNYASCIVDMYRFLLKWLLSLE